MKTREGTGGDETHAASHGNETNIISWRNIERTKKEKKKKKTIDNRTAGHCQEIVANKERGKPWE